MLARTRALAPDGTRVWVLAGKSTAVRNALSGSGAGSGMLSVRPVAVLGISALCLTVTSVGACVGSPTLVDSQELPGIPRSVVDAGACEIAAACCAGGGGVGAAVGSGAPPGSIERGSVG